MSQTVDCQSYNGSIKQILVKNLIPRVSVYAIIMENDHALLVLLSNGKYHFIGGGINVDENIEEALIRETEEESSLKVKMDDFVGYRKNFFYFDPSQKAYANMAIYHQATIVGGILKQPATKPGELISNIQWVPLINIHANMFMINEEYEMFLIARERYFRRVREIV